MTRQEWRTIREAEMNEMRQRQIKLVKTRSLDRKSLEEIIDKLKEWGIEVK